jgi:Flp pilus assembly protein TadD/TolB-like protein
MADVFVSYARADEARVKPIVEALTGAGFSVWWDHSLEPGTNWADIIDRELRRARCVVVVWSRQSLCSRWVDIEAHEARRRGILVPVLIEPVTLSEEFAGLHRLEWLADGADDDATRRLVEHVRGMTRRARQHRVLLATAAILFLGVGTWSSIQWLAPEQAPAGPASVIPAHSIAVLPFEQDAALGVPGLADGIAIDLIEELARVQGSRVASQVAAWPTASQPLETIRQRLRVAWLVEGNVAAAAGGGIRVGMRLVDTSNGFLRESWVLTAAEDELMQLTLAMVRHLAEALPWARPTEVEPSVDDIDGNAYRFYLLARALLSEGRNTVDRVRAESYLEEALALEPEFAPAHAGLCQVRLWRHELNQDPADLLRAEQQCAAAMALQPHDPTVLLAQAELEAARGHDRAAVQRLRTLLEGDPSNPDARRNLAQSLAAMGRTGDAEQEFRRVLREQPGHWSAHNAFATFLLSEGRVDEAVRQFVHALDLAPEEPSALSNLGVALLLADELQGATRAFQRSLALGETAPALSNLGTAYYYGKRMEDAAAVFERATSLVPNDFRVWSNLADARASLGDPSADDAYREAERLALARLSGREDDPTARVGLEAFRAALGTGSMAALDAALAGAPNTWEIQYFAALAFARLGDRESATERLLQAIDLGFPASLARRDPLLGPLVEETMDVASGGGSSDPGLNRGELQ